MSVQENPYRYIKKQNDKANDQVLEIIDKYRLLTGMTWREFIFSCIAFYIRQENSEIADAIIDYLNKVPKPGRPVGTSIKRKLNEMGVNPKHIQKPQF